MHTETEPTRSKSTGKQRRLFVGPRPKRCGIWNPAYVGLVRWVEVARGRSASPVRARGAARG